MTKTIKIIIVFLAISLFSSAQEPSYYTIGEEELSGIHIYDILQDNEQYYWLATNQGLIKFDGYSFINIPSQNVLGNSVFDLKIDYDNNLYCKNLSGQILKIENDTCNVYFQVPDSLSSSTLDYDFDNNNEMVIAVKTIIKFKNNKIDFLYQSKIGNLNFTEMTRLSDSSLVIYNTSTKEVLKYKNNKIHYILLKNPKHYYIQIFEINGKVYYYDKAQGLLFENINNEFSLKKSTFPMSRLYIGSKNFWFAQEAGGLKAFDVNFQPLYNSNLIFKNNIISSFCKSNEGDIILGTFGEGLIIIPNLHLSNLSLPNFNVKNSAICLSDNKNTFIGTQDGRIFKIDTNDQPSLFVKKQIKSIEILVYLKEVNALLFDGKVTTIMNLDTKKRQEFTIGSVKDAIYSGNNSYILATNTGLKKLTLLQKKNKTVAEIESYFTQFNVRTHCVMFDSINRTIYAGTSLGLKIGNPKIADFFTLDNQIVMCKDMLFYKGKIFISTHKNGILIFKNNKLIANWKGEDFSITNNINKIKEYDGNIYISSNSGIKVVSTEGKLLYTLNKTQGFASNSIIDFEIKDNTLWFIYLKGIQKLNLHELNIQNYKPTIEIKKIFVKDSSIYFSDKQEFDYFQNRLKFQLSANSIKYKNEIEYHYQLEGIDKEWQINAYEHNEIEYKSLPPGDYKFKVKAVYRKNESELLIYQFSISSPIWKTWWFFVIFTALGAGSTILFFRIRIRRIKRRTELEKQLKSSEITAIKAQMNPHFIFNVINSIQDLILKGDVDNSYSYLIEFSKLVRKTLNYSSKEFINIEDEIDLLKIYLELEKLRFKDDFEYSINLNNIEGIQVPPMLIQPFVENAIKHGLLHKEGVKKLEINFENKEQLICTVIDNGVGRRKAKEIKERQQKAYKSFSVNATKRRFEIMSTYYQKNVDIFYTDLGTETKSEGTKVMIKMPFRHKY